MAYRQLRLAIVGFGTVGRWLASAIDRRRRHLESEYGVDVLLVSVASRRHGFVYREAGFEIPTLLGWAADGRSLADYPGARWWKAAAEGLAQTECDVMAEASGTNPREPEPALSHIRQALRAGTHVITSSKGACAAAGVELLSLAQQQGVQCRMEATVMSGTPVLSTIRDGLAGARPLALRGILNATANYILTLMAQGREYAAALADAQAQGYAEPDPTDDVEGHDVVAKIRILAAMAFGQTVALDQVLRRGIADIGHETAQRAVREHSRIKLVASIRSRSDKGRDEGASSIELRVEPLALPLADPLARVDGVMNALTVETDTVREVTIIGPGAGPEQAGQGLFSDLLAIARGYSASHTVSSC